MLRLLPIRALLPLALIVAAPAAHATEVWSGRVFPFAKAPFADPKQPVNQDRITTQVWITRASLQGIFNIEQEASYTHNLSPKGTEWATGDAVDHSSLTFSPWEIWAGNNPPATVGVNAVVHLIAEDIYLDIVFDSWGGSGGAFSYHRAIQPAISTTPASWGRIKRLFR